MATERVCVGKSGAAHGVRGEVRLIADTEDPLAIRSYGELEDESGARRFRIASLRQGSGHLVVRFNGIDDRDAAAKLTHVELYVPRSRLPKQKEDGVFYHADLIGLRVETKSGEELGKVIAVQNFGAGDLLDVQPVKGGASVLVPFIDEYVPVVDVKAGRIVADPPLGLFEDGDQPEPT
jgi:16S rRNA processing protein RimM